MPLPSDVAAAIPFRSGSESLLQLLLALRERSETRGTPVAALPAYGCPLVLGAVLGAGWSPRFFDFEPESFSTDLNSLTRAVDSGATVVISTDLFGIPDRSADLRKLCGAARAFLIRDVAQCALRDVARSPLDADAGIMSFGRGKPTSVLTGGGLLLGRERAALAASIERATPAARFSHIHAALRAIAYNVAIRPSVYDFVRRLPALQIGQSRLVVTNEARRLPPSLFDLVARMAATDDANSNEAMDANRGMIALLENNSVRVPKLAQDANGSRFLSRIPAFATDQERARRISGRAEAFGVTRMYGRTLPEFSGESADQAERAWPNAFHSSRRLLTFPASGRLPMRLHGALAECLR